MVDVCLVAILSLVVLPTVSRAAPESRTPRMRALTVRQALLRCAGSTAQYRDVSVLGYFQWGPMTDGPRHISGLLFDSKKVRIPPNINWDHTPPVERQGLSFIMGYERRFARLIHVGSHLLVHGTLSCNGGYPHTPYLKANSMRSATL
jgi:hypothetical protein